MILQQSFFPNKHAVTGLEQNSFKEKKEEETSGGAQTIWDMSGE